MDLYTGGVTMPPVVTPTLVALALALASPGLLADTPLPNGAEGPSVLAPATGLSVATPEASTPAPVPEGDAPASTPPVAVPPDDVTEVVISAPEPRYVSPTRRDRIGRIWAPVYINDRGPFRLVLDTGASRSCIIARVASILNLTPDPSASIRLQAVTGSATVPTVRVNSLLIGDLLINGSKLPIIPDALGGAEPRAPAAR